MSTAPGFCKKKGCDLPEQGNSGWCKHHQPKVDFCNWCSDPHNPDPKYHPDGQAEHRIPKPSIAELEAMLEQEEDIALEILPNGEIRQKDRTPESETRPLKPLL